MGAAEIAQCLNALEEFVHLKPQTCMYPCKCACVCTHTLNI